LRGEGEGGGKWRRVEELTGEEGEGGEDGEEGEKGERRGSSSEWRG